VLPQMLTDSLLLAVICGAGGLLLGYLGRSIIPSLLSNAWERNTVSIPIEFSPDFSSVSSPHGTQGALKH
jgi:hypothetical protein